MFLSNKILKVGQSFPDDLRKMQESYRKMKCFSCIKHYLDISEFAQKVHQTTSTNLALVVAKELSKINIILTYIDVLLCKEEQISNWENRPLTRSQTHYAIADAFILVLLFEAFQKKYVNYKL
jgi:ribonuclease D